MMSLDGAGVVPSALLCSCGFGIRAGSGISRTSSPATLTSSVEATDTKKADASASVSWVELEGMEPVDPPADSVPTSEPQPPPPAAEPTTEPPTNEAATPEPTPADAGESDSRKLFENRGLILGLEVGVGGATGTPGTVYDRVSAQV